MTQPSPHVPRLVVDASVVLKWQLDDEEGSEQALALRDDFLLEAAVALAAPSLLLYEVTNGVHRAARRMRLDAAVAEQALTNLVACEIELHQPDSLHTLRLARRYGLGAYDAAYLALADELDAELWTADRPLVDGTRDAPRPARWIGEYERVSPAPRTG